MSDPSKIYVPVADRQPLRALSGYTHGRDAVAQANAATRRWSTLQLATGISGAPYAYQAARSHCIFTNTLTRRHVHSGRRRTASRRRWRAHDPNRYSPGGSFLWNEVRGSGVRMDTKGIPGSTAGVVRATDVYWATTRVPARCGRGWALRAAVLPLVSHLPSVWRSSYHSDD